jgi:uncharacterized damage-inducible protein DinB
VVSITWERVVLDWPESPDATGDYPPLPPQPRWANDKLIDFLAGQPESVLELTGAGSYGNVGTTLVHLAGAQERYAQRLPGGSRRPDPVHESAGWPGFERIRESLEWSQPLLLAAAETTPEDEFVEVEFRGKPVRMMLATVLSQAINHATEHRVNITTTLAGAGIEHPELDVWAYAEEIWP